MLISLPLSNWGESYQYSEMNGKKYNLNFLPQIQDWINTVILLCFFFLSYSLFFPSPIFHFPFLLLPFTPFSPFPFFLPFSLPFFPFSFLPPPFSLSPYFSWILFPWPNLWLEITCSKTFNIFRVFIGSIEKLII